MKTKQFPHRIVVISEDKERTDDFDVFSGSLEASSRNFLKALSKEIKTLGYEYVHYTHPIDLARNIDQHKMDLVLAIWNGENSPSRVSIIPSICETGGIQYIGANAASRAICNDKELSKSIASKLGFKVAKGLRLVSDRDLRFIESISLPIIVKPCLEGSSIGITRDSVCTNYKEAEERIKLLWEKGFEHVYAEEFIIGREICLCLMGSSKGPRHANAVEITIAGDPEYLRQFPYDAEIKKGRIGERKLDILEDGLLSAEISLAKTAFKHFGKMNLFRVDGRLNDQGEFIFIEFATQPTFGKASETYVALAEYYPNYGLFIKALLEMEIELFLDQDTSLSV